MLANGRILPIDMKASPFTVDRIDKIEMCPGPETHKSLLELPSCKHCWSIASLRSYCKRTTSKTTGKPLVHYGTKETMLTRLIRNQNICSDVTSVTPCKSMHPVEKPSETPKQLTQANLWGEFAVDQDGYAVSCVY